MLDFTRSLASLCLAALATAALVVSMAGCSVIGEGNAPWDTDIPESEAFDAADGTWGPDGIQIAFEYTPETLGAEPGESDQLWIANLEADTRRKVAPGRVVGLDWSPDGEWFVFHTASIPRYLFKINVRGDSLVRLSGADSPNPDLEDTVAGRWSPSGDRILYAVSAGKPRGVSMMNPDGSGARILIPYGVMPNWFPNGESIVYVNWDTTVEEGRRRQIYRACADGTEIEKLTDLPDSGIINYPSVSPDGAHIAFVYRAEDQSAEVFLMRADGTNIRQVTRGPGIARSPEWHPNGEKILFERFIPNVSHHLYVLNVETLEVEPAFPASPD